VATDVPPLVEDPAGELGVPPFERAEDLGKGGAVDVELAPIAGELTKR
jgi:hypothetical protein